MGPFAGNSGSAVALPIEDSAGGASLVLASGTAPVYAGAGGVTYLAANGVCALANSPTSETWLPSLPIGGAYTVYAICATAGVGEVQVGFTDGAAGIEALSVAVPTNVSAAFSGDSGGLSAILTSPGGWTVCAAQFTQPSAGVYGIQCFYLGESGPITTGAVARMSAAALAIVFTQSGGDAAYLYEAQVWDGAATADQVQAQLRALADPLMGGVDVTGAFAGPFLVGQNNPITLTISAPQGAPVPVIFYPAMGLTVGPVAADVPANVVVIPAGATVAYAWLNPTSGYNSGNVTFGPYYPYPAGAFGTLPTPTPSVAAEPSWLGGGLRLRLLRGDAQRWKVGDYLTPMRFTITDDAEPPTPIDISLYAGTTVSVAIYDQEGVQINGGAPVCKILNPHELMCDYLPQPATDTAYAYVGRAVAKGVLPSGQTFSASSGNSGLPVIVEKV